MKRINERGRRYGRLKVIRPEGWGWLCRCDCGETKAVPGCLLRSGDVKSCGCLWSPTLQARLKKYVRRGRRCWPWRGPTIRGYASTKIHGRRILVHRAVWESRRGTIPVGMMVLHHCDNPPCVRLAHLYLGTAIENARDRTMRGRNNHAVKLSNRNVRTIRALVAAGRHHRELAKRFGISKTYVSRIALRKVRTGA